MKTLLPFLYPLPLGLVLGLAGLVALFITGRLKLRGWGALAAMGYGLIVLASLQWPAHALMERLEFKHPAYNEAVSAAAPTPTRIVVLGGGVAPSATRSLTSDMSPATLVRLVEGIRIHRLHPGSHLVLSGGGKASLSEASVMADLAEAMGVDRLDIEIEDGSANTAAQAVNLRPSLESQPFVLVTSADHMPRSVAAFAGVGLSPTPAPVGQQTRMGGTRMLDIFSTPHSSNLQIWERLIYEHLGLIAIDGQVKRALKAAQ